MINIYEIRYPNGTFYEGTLINGRRQGFGRMVRPNGSASIGMWVNGRLFSGLKIFANRDFQWICNDWRSERRRSHFLIRQIYQRIINH